MLEIKEYPIGEIAMELHIAPTVQNMRQCVTNKLNRLKISFQVNGRGRNTVFRIIEIPDRFALYCITEFGCGTNTDFKKLREVFYFSLNDDSFLSLTHLEKEQFLQKRNILISRETISRYIQILINADYLGGAEPVYLVIRKNAMGLNASEEITKERYCKGWNIYWTTRAETYGDYFTAYVKMHDFLNGHPLKHMRPLQNAIMHNEIEQLQQLIAESYLNELSAK